MNIRTISILFLIVYNTYTSGQSKDFSNPIITENVVFQEASGLVAVEAEYFYKQSNKEVRAWYRTSKNETTKVDRDADNAHVHNSSNNAYIEILPDTRITHDDTLEKGKNFSDKPGELAVLHYKVNFTNPGRYYVWARAYSSGSEDNGLHVGLNNEWPESGQRMQWCDGKNKWTGESKQRTKEVHCGIPHDIYLDIKEAGVHDIQFSMREDGFEFDKFLLTKDKQYVPIGQGPKVIANKKLPKPYPNVTAPSIKENYFRTIAAKLSENKILTSQDFPFLGTDFYKNGKNWMAINPKTYKEAVTSTVFNFESGVYDLVFVGVAESDGSSTFTIEINGQELGVYNPPIVEKMFEEGKNSTRVWERVSLTKGDKLTVKAKIGTDGKEFTRGRWAGIIFAPTGKGKTIINATSSFTQN